MNAPPFLSETPGPVAVAVPHMDDEAIGCGALLASLKNDRAVYLFFSGEGLGSFTPGFVAEHGREALVRLRMNEAFRAADCLGIRRDRISFGGFQEWQFSGQRSALKDRLSAWLDHVRPALVLAPFRLDCHADHTVLSELAHEWVRHCPQVRLLEYFVYHRSRLLPGGDMRRLIRSPFLIAAPSLHTHVRQKEKALRAYVSQTTRFDPARPKPVLDAAFIAATISDEEHFVDAGSTPVSLLVRRSWYARAVSRWQFPLKGIRDMCTGGPLLHGRRGLA